MKQWKCPKCGGDSIIEEFENAFAWFHIKVDTHGQLFIVDDDIEANTVRFGCMECDYNFPPSVINWETLEDFIGD